VAVLVVEVVVWVCYLVGLEAEFCLLRRVEDSRISILVWRRGKVADLGAGGRTLLQRITQELELDNAWRGCPIRFRVLGSVRSSRAGGGVVSREPRRALSWNSSRVQL